MAFFGPWGPKFGPKYQKHSVTSCFDPKHDISEPKLVPCGNGQFWVLQTPQNPPWALQGSPGALGVQKWPKSSITSPVVTIDPKNQTFKGGQFFSVFSLGMTHMWILLFCLWKICVIFLEILTLNFETKVQQLWPNFLCCWKITIQFNLPSLETSQIHFFYVHMMKTRDAILCTSCLTAGPPKTSSAIHCCLSLGNISVYLLEILQSYKSCAAGFFYDVSVIVDMPTFAAWIDDSLAW